jgi:hypothetical protein
MLYQEMERIQLGQAEENGTLIFGPHHFMDRKKERKKESKKDEKVARNPCNKKFLSFNTLLRCNSSHNRS